MTLLLAGVALCCFVSMLIAIRARVSLAGRLEAAEDEIEALKWKLGECRLWADLELEPPPWVKRRWSFRRVK